jgi:hypothetical protein
MSKKKPMSWHHRKCKSNGGDTSPGNMVLVQDQKHKAFHLLFQNHPAEIIAEILNQTWIDPQFKLIVRRRR